MATNSTIDLQRGPQKFLKILPKRYNSGSAPHFRSRKPGHTYANQDMRVNKKIDDTIVSHVERQDQRNGRKASIGARDGTRRLRLDPRGYASAGGYSSKTRLRDAADQCSKVAKIWSHATKEEDVSLQKKLPLPWSARGESNGDHGAANVCTLAETGVSSRKNEEGILQEVKSPKGSSFSNHKNRASKNDNCNTNTRKPANQGPRNKAECLKSLQDRLHSEGLCATQKKNLNEKTSSDSGSGNVTSSSILKDATLRPTSRKVAYGNSMKKKFSNGQNHLHDKTKKEGNLLPHESDDNSPKCEGPASRNDRERVLYSNPIRRRGHSLPKPSPKKVAIPQGTQHVSNDISPENQSPTRCDNKELIPYPSRGLSLPKLRLDKVAIPQFQGIRIRILRRRNR